MIGEGVGIVYEGIREVITINVRKSYSFRCGMSNVIMSGENPIGLLTT